MFFRQPGILYFLIFLIVPIVVHLFKLRKFQKEYFTNVELLKQIQLKTRKSSELKKWLTLAMRLLALSCIILAFAQPFFPAVEKSLASSDTLIYLDNSLSMQANGKSGQLLSRAVQDLLSDFPQDIPVTVVTNDQVFQKSPLKNLKNELLELDYSTRQLSQKELVIKIKQLFSKKDDRQRNLLLISDFQNFSPADFDSLKTPGLKIRYAKQKGYNQANRSVDSLSVEEAEGENVRIKIWVRSDLPVENVPVSIFVGNELAGKASITIGENKVGSTQFSIPKAAILSGYVQIEDTGFYFDNRLYFAIDFSKKIKIRIAGKAETGFLKRIYTQDEFEVTETRSDQLDFNQLSDQNLIILNELGTLPAGWTEILVKFHQNGGSLLVIMPLRADLTAYNLLFEQLNAGRLSEVETNEMFITTIHFSHPLFKNVFEQTINNFDYPKVETYYPFAGKNSGNILSFENGDAFFVNPVSNVYVLTASLMPENSNFINSPLIVPSFYNVASQSFALQQPYYSLGSTHTIDVEIELKNDEVLKIKNKESNYIPLQTHQNKKVSLTFDEFPAVAGLYEVYLNDFSVKTIAFNDNRNENKPPPADADFQNKQIEKFDTTQDLLNEIKSQGKDEQFWKGFVIFAVLFLVAETLILKYIP